VVVLPILENAETLGDLVHWRIYRSCLYNDYYYVQSYEHASSDLIEDPISAVNCIDWNTTADLGRVFKPKKAGECEGKVTERRNRRYYCEILSLGPIFRSKEIQDKLLVASDPLIIGHPINTGDKLGIYGWASLAHVKIHGRLMVWRGQRQVVLPHKSLIVKIDRYDRLKNAKYRINHE
jgi:hypothetical protein